MIVCNRYHSTRDFTWNAETRCFVAEASDLGSLGGHDSRVYDDACDAGFVLVSHVTGDSVLFVEDGTDTDSEGGVAGWRYRAYMDSSPVRTGVHPRWVKTRKDFTALVIND